MKRKTKNITTATAGRSVRWLPLVAFAAMLAACTADNDTLPADGSSNTPVAFTAGIESVALPGTRTVIGENGQTQWTQGDRVGIFMYKAGGVVSDDILSGAENIAYSVDPITGALSPDDTPIYYPKDHAVSFAAYHPYQSPAYLQNPPIGDQTTVEKQSAVDYLYSDNAQNIRSGRNPVALEFRHLLSKIKLDITLGDGLADGQITEAVMQGQQVGFAVDLQKGEVRQVGPMALGPISMLQSTTPTAGADATFTALVYGLFTDAPIVITVNGTKYTGILASEILDPNKMYVYPVTVRRTGVDVGTPTIAPWDTNDHGSSAAVEVGKGIEKVRILAGTFQMGSPSSAPVANKIEKPQHWVRLTKDFYLGKYEVTRTQYAEFLNATGVPETVVGGDVMANVEGYGEQKLFQENEWGWTPTWNDVTKRWEAEGDYPMIYVTWYGAKAYADWVGGRLPTEAEWEYACRAGTTTIYSFGDDASILGDYAVYSENKENDGPSRVGTKKPNPWGLYDMHGNVLEWCMDSRVVGEGYPTAPTEADAVVNPQVAEGSMRVFRGGSWNYEAGSSRSAARGSGSPSIVYHNIGFRVAFSLSE